MHEVLVVSVSRPLFAMLSNRNILIICGVAVLFWLVGFLIPTLFCSLEKSGQFGDTFGTVTSLFSGLGFAALIFIMRLQQQAHRNARNEDDIKFLYENISNIISHFNEYEFRDAVGTKALDEFAKYLQIEPADNTQIRATTELLRIIIMTESLEQTLHNNMNNYPRDRFEVLRSRFEFMKIRYVTRLRVNDTNVHEQQRVNSGGIAESVHIRVGILLGNNFRLLFPDEVPSAG